MIHVFVSGCYDLLHAGHVQFFKEARSLGDHLTVCFASEEVLWQHKRRRSSLPDAHKRSLLESLVMVDRVVIGEGETAGLDFLDHFKALRPEILAVTEDDQYESQKQALCDDLACRYVKLPKTPPNVEPVSTSALVAGIRAPEKAPLRVDFAGGWLDVPRYARQGAHIVNCAISPVVSLREWPYEHRAGLGGSGAWAMLNGRDGIEAELDLGVGWQDPAIIAETGLCVWQSGPRPVLEVKTSGALLGGRMALLWTGREHDTPGVVDQARDYGAIEIAGRMARDAVWANDFGGLAAAVRASYGVQRSEAMRALPEVASAAAWKYCGGGFGGYAVYLFDRTVDRDEWVKSEAGARAIEPYLRGA
jgi:cytidyltransferase-like protein